MSHARRAEGRTVAAEHSGRSPLYPEIVVDDAPVAELVEFATSYRDETFSVHKVSISLDEGQDGEPVTRVLLLLSDPAGDTWDVDRIRELRLALGRKATELGLPPVSLTLVAESEVEAEEAFAQ